MKIIYSKNSAAKTVPVKDLKPGSIISFPNVEGTYMVLKEGEFNYTNARIVDVPTGYIPVWDLKNNNLRHSFGDSVSYILHEGTLTLERIN